MEKDKLDAYLAFVGITGDLATRVHSVYTFYSDQLEVNVSDVFVSEYTTGYGTRVSDSLWFFIENHAMEAKIFVQDDSFDLAHLKHSAIYISSEKEEYDLIIATPKFGIELTINYLLVIED